MPHEDSARPSRLIGREEQLQTLQAALRSGPSLTLLVGEAGTGKSRLLVEAAQAQPVPYLTGYCRPVRGQSPLTPIAEALASAPTSGTPGFSGLMATLASLGPVVLVLEDLHWAEPATLQLLRLIVGRLPKDVRLVGTYRPEDTVFEADLTMLAGCVPPGTRTTEIRLEPLSHPEVGELAADLLGIDRVPPGLAQDLHHRSGGLPFVVAEYLRSVPVGRDGVTKAVERAIAETRAPVALRAAMTLRLENVPDACRQLVWAAAVLDAPAAETVLGAIAGIAEDDRPETIDTALARGLLGQPRPGLYDLRHALARRAVYDAIPPTRLRRLHRRTAEVLAELQPADHRGIADHFRHGGQLQGWLHHAELAATESAAGGDVVAATDQLVELVRVRALPWADRARLAAQLGHLSIGTRRWIDAVAVLRHVLAEAPEAPSTSRGQARFALGTLLVESAGQLDAGRRLIAESFDELVPAAPAEAARAAAYLAIPTGGPEPFTRHQAWLRRATELAPDDPKVQHLLRLGESPVDRAPRSGDLFASGNWIELERELLRARAEAVHRPPARAEVQLVEGRLRLAQGDLVSAKELLGAVEGDLRVRHAAVASLARMRMLQDRPEAAWRTVEESVGVVRHKHGWAWSAELIVVACQALARLDRFDEAAALVAELAAVLADSRDEVALAALEYARAVVGEPVSFKQVAATYRDLGRPYDQYLVLEHSARQELREGKPELLVTLAADFDRLGARWDAQRCRRTLRDAGVAAPGRRGRRGYGNALSPRELEVARLAARGLSNSRIAAALTLSVSTVEDHLSRALRKLKITSRRELAPFLPPDPERDH